MLVSTTDALDDPCNKCPDCKSEDIEDIYEE
jgi:predicted Zn-ribbon and HTH transcriptional regulator